MVKEVFWIMNIEIRNFIPVVFLLIVGLSLSSCVTPVTTEVKGGGPSVQQVTAYTGPKARISVARIKCKAAKCSGAIGNGLRDILISGLFKTNKFIVLGGKEEMQEMMEELDLSASGYVKEKSAIQAGGWEAADLIIFGSVTAFEPDAGGMDVGGGGLVPGLLGGVKFGKKEAYISMDLRLVDVRTRRIVNTTTVEGKASSFNVGGLGVGWGAAGILGGGLGVYKNTPMEKAVRVLIENAVNYVASQTPENYFRYTPEGTEVSPEGVKKVSSGLKRTGGPAGGGGLKRLSTGFEPGSEVLFAEDFSECTEKPKTLRIVNGNAECVDYDDRRWLVNITPQSTLKRKLDLKGDFAIEFDVYLNCKTVGCFLGTGFSLTLGQAGKGEQVLLTGNYGNNGKFFNLYFPTKSKHIKVLANKSFYKFAIQQKDGKIRLFLDGKRIATEEPHPFKAGKNRNGFHVWQKGNLDEENYVLITNIRVTKY